MPGTRASAPYAVAVALLALACSDSTTGPASGSDPAFTVSDASLQGLVATRSTWIFYKNRPDTLSRASGSGHAETRLRTLYNPRAATQLDAAGKVRAGAVFPDSSVIVKELINGSTLSRLAVMMKLPTSPQAGTGGWVWAEYTPAGAVSFAVSKRGSGCTGCHGSGTDFTRMNDSHP